jgi:zinc transporter 9
VAGGSKAAVYSAIGANAFVMVAKFVGFALTGSGTMLAEGIHSLADVGNQSLLAVGMSRAQQPATPEHPYGYGRDAFVWALMSAVGIFFLGCGVTVAHGVQSLLAGGHHNEASNPWINLGILALSLVAEGASLAVAVRGLQKHAKERGLSFREHIRTTDDVFGVAVLLEDSAAVLGVLIAFATVGLTHLTHASYWDPVGSLLIGVLLGGVAFVLMRRNRALLIGQSIGKNELAKVQEIFSTDPVVEHVAMSRAVVEGADAYHIAAEIDFDGRLLARRHLEGRDLDALAQELDSGEKLLHFLEEFGDAVTDQVGDEVDRLEARIRDVLPRARHVDLEPD